MNTYLLKSPIKLENERVLLIPFESLRNQELRNIIFEDQIWKFMGQFIRTDLDFEAYINTTLEAKANEICYPFLIIDKKTGRVAGSTRYGHLNPSYPFLIIDKKTGRVAGSTRYGHLNPSSEKCEIGWTWLGTDFQGTGLNKACKYELLKFGFETIGFRRIQFSADQENRCSQKAIEKLGAIKEGVFRNNYIAADGQSRNDVYYSLIRDDWKSIKQDRFAEFL